MSTENVEERRFILHGINIVKKSKGRRLALSKNAVEIWTVAKSTIHNDLNGKVVAIRLLVKNQHRKNFMTRVSPKLSKFINFQT